MSTAPAPTSLAQRSNLILLGLPGSGKSTIGARLAQHFKRPFLDTDRLIEDFTGKSLQQIVDTEGAAQLRAIEAQIVSGLEVRESIIATGGSVVYSEMTMHHLESLGLLLYLRARSETIYQRIGDYSQRGIARLPGQSIASVIEERLPLYARYANVVVDVDGLDEAEVMNTCVAMIESYGAG